MVLIVEWAFEMLEIYYIAQEGVIKNFRKDSPTGNLTTLFLQILKNFTFPFTT